jgi:hypothetical protein
MKSGEKTAEYPKSWVFVVQKNMSGSHPLRKFQKMKFGGEALALKCDL